MGRSNLSPAENNHQTYHSDAPVLNYVFLTYKSSQQALAERTQMTQEPFLSFLMPVYNAEKDLPAALDSIVSQDDGTIELICVNDGSKDSSGSILQDYAQRYPFIKVINQENQGITCARDNALAAASGTWICFADNDDIIAHDAVNVMHAQADDTCDIIYFQYSKFTTALPDESDNSVGSIRYFKDGDITKLQSDCINRFRDNTPLVPHTVLPTPWAKIYKRAFLAKYGLEFRREVTHEEDVTFNFEVLSHVTRAKAVDYVLYYYRWAVSSESHRYRPRIFDSTQKTLAAYRDIIHRCYPNRSDIADLYKYRVMWELQYCVYLGPMHRLNPAPYTERRKQFNRLLESEPYKGILSQINPLRFEPKQALLATLIKYRQFWLLNIIGKIVDKTR